MFGGTPKLHPLFFSVCFLLPASFFAAGQRKKGGLSIARKTYYMATCREDTHRLRGERVPVINPLLRLVAVFQRLPSRSIHVDHGWLGIKNDIQQGALLN